MTKRYAYKAHSPAMLARMIVVWCVSALLLYAAITWEGPLDTGLFVMSPSVASAFLWLLVAAMMPGALLFITMLLNGDLTPRQIVLGQTSFSGPRDGRNLPNVVVPYKAITKVEMVAIHGNRYIEVRSKGGRMSFSEVCMPGNSSFESLYDNLFTQAGANGDLNSRH
ncbi:MAG: hypothetical protein EOO28_24510 [Comamonadaceae bacterium]|nr:MAG: hypothetical protein EOO28_24510 [Comamonadaceae bacterium]